jgi:hypothetical protein
VSRSLAQALAAYVNRRRFFSPDRRREVARHLAQPLLERFGFPTNTSYDLLLCSLYHRTFVADRLPADGPESPAGSMRDFAPAAASEPESGTTVSSS